MPSGLSRSKKWHRQSKKEILGLMNFSLLGCYIDIFISSVATYASQICQSGAICSLFGQNALVGPIQKFWKISHIFRCEYRVRRRVNKCQSKYKWQGGSIV